MLAKDITGMRSGRLVAVKPTGNRHYDHIVWQCRCDCGKIHNTAAYRIINKSVKSCGCVCKESAKRSAFKMSQLNIKDIAGQKFGRLTAIRSTGQKSHCYIWEFKCDCGKTVEKPINYVTSGKQRSCGCLQEANRMTKGTHIDPMDVPFEITRLIAARRVLKKAMAV